MATNSEVRVNFIADIAKFVSPLGRANNELERFGQYVERAGRNVEKAFKKAGTDLTIRVTAPLVALAAASIKAADKSGDFSDALQRLKLEALGSLEPLGRSLAGVLESFRPSIETGIKFVNGLAESFAQLDPEMQRQIVLWGVAAAALGPALYAMAGLASVAKLTGSVLAGTGGVISGLTKDLQRVAITIDGVKVSLGQLGVAAVGGFSVGQWLYDEFKVVQIAASGYLGAWQAFWTTVYQIPKTTFISLAGLLGTAIAGLEGYIGNALVRQADALTTAASYIPAQFAGIATGINAAAGGIKSAGNDMLLNASKTGINVVGLFVDQGNDLVDSYKSIYQRMLAELGETDREFAGAWRKHPDQGLGKSFVDFQTEQLSKLASNAKSFAEEALGAIAGVDLKEELGAWKKFFDDALKLGKLPDVITPRDLKALDDASKKLATMRDEAGKIRMDVMPEEDMRQQLARLDELRAAFPAIIDDQVWARQVDKIKDKFVEILPVMERVGRKIRDVIQAASTDASDSLARFLVEGEFKIGDFFKRIAERLISVASNTAIFDPLFKSLGGIIGSLFAGGAEVYGPPTPYWLTPGGGGASALGNIFAKGRLVPFAAGAIIGGPTMFPMANGATGLMGEAGPEAIMPLARNASGELGVKASGGGVVVNIIDQRSGGSRPEVSQGTGPDGRRTISVLIRDEVNAGLASGAFDQSLSRGFGVNRQPARR